MTFHAAQAAAENQWPASQGGQLPDYVQYGFGICSKKNICGFGIYYKNIVYSSMPCAYNAALEVSISDLGREESPKNLLILEAPAKSLSGYLFC